MTRHNFLKLLLAGATFAPALPVLGAGLDELRGDRVGWARLKTASPHWLRHSRGDPVLMRFLRKNTSLNIDSTWYVADVERLNELCIYPLLFSQSISVVNDATGRTNVAEYIRRGGFMLVDACCNLTINPSFDVFLQQQTGFLAEVLPEARVVLLPADHPIYRCFFQIPNGHPPHTFFNNVYDPHKAGFGLYAIRIGRRTAGIISLSGLQCGWDRMVAPPGHDVACMKMLVNIYIYAMTEAG